MNETALRGQLLKFGRLCWERHLLVAMDGNLSVRLGPDTFLCTRAGCHKGFLEDDDLVVIDGKGNKLRGKGQPTSEMAMHLACYEERPDVHAVIHTHPPLAIAFTLAGVSMARCVLPEVVLTLGAIPTAEYATTGTRSLADGLRPHVRGHDVVLMDRHGAVALGKDLLTAFCNLETLEHTALITKTARDLGNVRELPPAEAVRLRELGLRRYGGPPAAVAQLGAPGADLPKACTDCSGCAHPRPGGVGPATNLRLARVTERPLQSSALEDALVMAVLERVAAGR